MGILYTCNFTFNTTTIIPPMRNPNIGNQLGGRLTAANTLWTQPPPGTAPAIPVLNGNTAGQTNGDSMQAQVTFGTSNGAILPVPPLTATFTYTPSNDAPASQVGASPFVGGGTYTCSQVFAKVQPQSGRNSPTATYVFGPTPIYNGGLPGNYELTIVIQDSSTSPVQWSIDPEFETGS